MFKKSNFIERSLLGVLSFLKESVFADDYALQKGFLQARSSRLKSAGFLLLIVSVLLARDIRVLSGLYIFCLILAAFSKISMRYFLKRTWVFIPLFSFFIALPALFNIVTPGEALVSFKFFGEVLSVTRPGLWGAVIFVARVAASVSFVVLLALTTRHSELLKALS